MGSGGGARAGSTGVRRWLSISDQSSASLLLSIVWVKAARQNVLLASLCCLISRFLFQRVWDGGLVYEVMMMSYETRKQREQSQWHGTLSKQTHIIFVEEVACHRR